MITYFIIAFTCGWCLYWFLYSSSTGRDEDKYHLLSSTSMMRRATVVRHVSLFLCIVVKNKQLLLKSRIFCCNFSAILSIFYRYFDDSLLSIFTAILVQLCQYFYRYFDNTYIIVIILIIITYVLHLHSIIYMWTLDS